MMNSIFENISNIIRAFKLFAPVFLLGFIFSCASVQPPPEEKPEPAVEEQTLPEPVMDVQKETYSSFIMASIYISRGEFEEAKEYLSIAVHNNPDSIYLNKKMAVLMHKLNNTKEAFRYAHRCVEIDPNDISSHVLLAELYAFTKDKESEIEEYNTVLTLDPKNQRIRMVLATILIRNRRLNEALAHLDELTLQNPDLILAYYYRGRIYLEMDKYEQAEKEYLKALELNESMEPALFDLASLYQIEKRFEDAIEIYNRVIKNYPSNLAAKERLLNIYEKLGQTDKTKELIEEIKNQTEPGDPDRQTLGLFYLQHGKLAESIAELDLIVTAWPEDSKSRYYLALAYQEYGQPEAALEHFRQIKEGTEYFIRSQMHMAVILEKMGKYDEAVERLRHAIELDRTESDLYRFLAAVYEAKEEYDKAIETIKEGLKYDAKNTDLIFRYGVILDKSGDKEGSIEQMRNILLLDPNHADSLNYIGYTYAEKGINLDEALELIQRALKIKPNSGYIIDSLGWVYYQQGQYQKALASLEKAFSLISDDPTIAEHLGDVYQKINNLSKSLEMYEKAIELKHQDQEVIREKIEKIKQMLK
jgi:tetratricopeptide (TPR) repeat protein